MKLISIIFFLVLSCFMFYGFAQSPTFEGHITSSDTIQSNSAKEIRGLIKAEHEAVLSTDVIARIASVNYKTGEKFNKDDKLIEFDCERQNAELSAATSELKAKEMVYKNNQDLSQFDAVGNLELEVSKSQYHKALAELNLYKIRRHECVILAPWNGRVTEVNAHAVEIIEPGYEIMKILDDTSLEVKMIVPSHWLRWLETGINFPITIDETGNDYEIEITRIGANVDPVSQTIQVFASFTENTNDVLAGMSGTVFFDLPD